MKPESRKGSFFAAVLLPPIVLQSLIMGGGYSTGREVVEYAGRFGDRGWLSVAIITVGFSLLAVLAFELARLSRSYDYKRWIGQLIGPLWPLFDLLLLAMMLLVVSVMSAAMGSILETTLGLPQWIGLTVAFVAVGGLAYAGVEVMERFKVVGTVALYVGYLAFAVLVLRSAPDPDPVRADASASAVEPWSAVALAGVLYVGYNLAVFPASLFCLYRQRERWQTVAAGLLSGLAMTVPFVLTFVCLVRYWPDPDVIDAEVPWLVMLDRAGGAGLIAVFGVVAGWTLLETAVGSIHALVDRVEKNLGDLPRRWRPVSGELSSWQRAAVAVGVLTAATLLARVGIIALVAQGYSTLAWGFIVLLALPLLVVGTARFLLRA